MPVSLVCEFCSEEYEVIPSRSEDSRFCSKECQSNYQKEAFSGENNPCWRGGHKVSVQCSVCGKTVKRRKDRLGEQVFCSPNCEGTWKSNNWTGENSPAWKGGAVNYYGPNWPEKRTKALKRDSYICQECGKTEREHQKEHGSSLEVHHKRRIAEFESTEKANKLTNLVTLCCRCHNRVEKTV